MTQCMTVYFVGWAVYDSTLSGMSIAWQYLEWIGPGHDYLEKDDQCLTVPWEGWSSAWQYLEWHGPVYDCAFRRIEKCMTVSWEGLRGAWQYLQRDGPDVVAVHEECHDIVSVLGAQVNDSASVCTAPRGAAPWSLAPRGALDPSVCWRK